jgi:hypothetical protein
MLKESGFVMATLEQVRAALDAMNPATVEDVRITTEEDGLSIAIRWRRPEEPLRPVPGGVCRSAEERRRLISEGEQQFAGRGDEDSEAWIEDIRASRSFTKLKTYEF